MEETTNKESKNERIEKYLSKNYNFRYNTIKCRTEWFKKNKSDDGGAYFPVTKYKINSIRRELDNTLGIITSADNIRTILESDFSRRVNPIHEYFKQLPRLQSVDHITELASTVKVQNAEHWVNYLSKWLMGVVANAMNDIGCQNHLCLVLTGEQGKFKTTWLDHLCPKSLNNYLYTGKIDPRNKDVQTYIAEYLFINIDDQLKALNKKDENELKNLITTPSVKYRRPYDVYIEEYPHLASFMASVNGNDFLTDPTGSRRFLPFEVLEIDIDRAKRVNMDDVYSEVLNLLEHNNRYWFNDEEIAELHSYSSAFHVQTIEYEMLILAFDKPIPFDESFMTTMQIMNHLTVNTRLVLSEKRLGEALRKAGFERRSKRVNGKPIYGWEIRKIHDDFFNPSDNINTFE